MNYFSVSFLFVKHSSSAGLIRIQLTQKRRDKWALVRVLGEWPSRNGQDQNSNISGPRYSRKFGTGSFLSKFLPLECLTLVYWMIETFFFTLASLVSVVVFLQNLLCTYQVKLLTSACISCPNQFLVS